ncbi:MULTISPECIES: transporter substrate-binding domain-containing protein [unclassified Pseudomonas]|uniref:transporter substrate-binding domain-containing protein n=1 Tax=unclassified Pseudomonas TaxID=196821 RepID=UPI002AC99C4A|nr:MULTISPECIES: transporter substrate-binding domain-containing protein [unclassified Pseudomonas]MEB0044897.1 transporter substrate-binding domain-containing protein [Pseudomonas sp. Dout3]MEB0096091.1 transporter substrate-binding domain-containing protein [Pseudomonas sp. DC1.2]WPX61655.1 transporter substrate-binding domain-containing protein [Pseudomonas sp. DC1.2]
MPLVKIPALFFLMSLTTGCVSSAVDPQIRFGVEALVPPFESRDDKGELVGLNIELGNALCAELNARCVWVDQDYATNIEALEAGRFDAIMPMTPTPARRERIDFTENLYPLSSRLVAREDAGLQPTALSLKGKRVGVLAGTSREAFAKARWAPEGVVVRSFNFNDQLIASLAAGEIDATLQDTIEITHALLNHPYGRDFSFAGPALNDPMLGSGVAMALRKTDTVLRDNLNAALERLKQNGQYQTITQRYLPPAVADVPRYFPNDEGLPFSDAVQVGETVYLSGVVGLGTDGKLVKGGIVPQMTQTMHNLRAALISGGSSLDHVAKCTVILADIKDFGAMNEVYKRSFPADRLPARTTFAASKLVLNARVEVECLAVTAR